MTSDPPTITRRALFEGFISSSVIGATSTIGSGEPNDAKLIALGRRLDLISEALEHAGDHDVAMKLLEKIESVSNAMAFQHAGSLAGISIKVRASSWAILNDFNPEKEVSIDMRLVVSILRDIMNLSDNTSP